jgi:hypothetical protein
MTAIHWNTATSGNFNTGSNWIGNSVPGSGDDAIIDATGSTYTVTSSQSNTVNDIRTVSVATLDITNGTFTATAGTGAGANAGTIIAENNTFFDVAGTVNNSGAIDLKSGGSDTRLRITTGGATLSGSGTITLSDNSNNSIDAAVSGVTLTNTNNTIQGAGDIGLNDGLTFVNQASGTVDATGANALRIDFGSKTVTNAGLFEATGSGGLTIVLDRQQFDRRHDRGEWRQREFARRRHHRRHSEDAERGDRDGDRRSRQPARWLDLDG